ncbi:MAG TPA: choice-of-anchor Q domain-containing protein [Terriglobales bacterium]|nr:choice-of-anchor Q domain-containing protein [Terriglobales bacterium]
MRRTFRRAVFSAIFLAVGVLTLQSLALASLTNVYVAQNAAGLANGSSCANAYAATFFNTQTNWGSGSSQIGPGTVVHVCGVWAGGNGVTFLKFQGSGSSGNVIELLFEAGAAMRPNYCSSAGCLDLNSQSYILIDGGTTCGETSHWSTTSCNGEIVDQTTGSSGAKCPNGSSCTTQLPDTTTVSAVGTNSGSPSNIEVRNLHIHLYTRLSSDTTGGGTSTYGIGLFGGTLAQGITVHNMMFDGMEKAYLISLGSASGTLSRYQLYDSNITDQCWAMGVGADAPSMNITNLQFHDNEVSNWDNWAPANHTNADCHTNGTMWFNGDGNTVHSGSGFIGDPTSMIYNNYIHGSLTGGYSGSSPSGMISCQDNCIDVAIFNNVVHYVNESNVGGGGLIYFNGAGGGQQLVYSNTLIEDSGLNGSCIVVTGTTGPTVVKDNIAYGCGDFIEIRPNCPTCVTSDDNDGYNITQAWVVNNSANSGQFISLATWQGTYGQDTHTTTGSPLLDASYKPQTGSAAIGGGANLTGVGITALNSDVAGVARPSGTTPWDIGAYQSGASAVAPAPPSGFVATVH